MHTQLFLFVFRVRSPSTCIYTVKLINVHTAHSSDILSSNLILKDNKFKSTCINL
jgi:hypothetical protein